MTQSTATTTPSQHALRPQHAGSASPTLSGRTIIIVWVASTGFHILLFLILLAIVFPYAPSRSRQKQPTMVTEVTGPIDGTPLAPSTVPAKAASTAQRPVRRFAPRKVASVAGLTTRKRADLSIIGIGVGGGDFADFGLSVGDGAGPDFFGLGSSSRGARKIVYVVDRSGSMLDTFSFVRDELKRSISALRRSQKFHVIFFNSGRPLESPPKRLVSAILANKKELFEFLDQVMPKGGTEPAAAMHRALSLEPDLVYLLSDGEDFRPSLLQKLDQWNPKRRVQIYTIAFVDRRGSEWLERIAREHHGRFKFVSEYDLP